MLTFRNKKGTQVCYTQNGAKNNVLLGADCGLSRDALRPLIQLINRNQPTNQLRAQALKELVTP